MDAVHPSRCVEWRWCVLLCRPVQWCGSCPTHPTAVLISVAVVSCTVPCQMLWCVGGGRLSVLFVWWGILCLLPPHVGGGWGRCGWWAAVVVAGGMVNEGRLCCWPPRLVCSVPRLCVGVPFVVYPVALLNGGVCWCVLSRVRIGSSPSRCLVPLVLSCPPYIVSLLLFSLPSLCSLS